MGLFRKEKGFEDLEAPNIEVFNSYTSAIEFTLLDPRTTEKDIVDLCNIAYKNKYYGVVVPPVWVKFARRYIDEKLSGTLRLISVVGFPLGYTTTKAKVVEAKELIKAGADELDVVINLTYLKSGDYNSVRYELGKIVRLSRKTVVKAIIETAYLSEDELEKVAKCLIKARVDFIKTSTGYAPIGATEEGVETLSRLLERSHVKIKASGGIKTKAQAENFIRLGATRIGTSRIL